MEGSQKEVNLPNWSKLIITQFSVFKNNERKLRGEKSFFSPVLNQKILRKDRIKSHDY